MPTPDDNGDPLNPCSAAYQPWSDPDWVDDFDDDEYGDGPGQGEPALDLGPCCICEGTERVVNILMLEQRCPSPGHGWGCVVCGLSADGATAVVCAACFERHAGDVLAHLRFACRGYPSEGRVAIGELAGRHECDMSQHPGEY